MKTVMQEMGMAMMGTGVARGEDRARIAAEAAISSPLLEEVSLSGARGVLVNITAGLDMSIGEFEQVGEVIKGFTSEDATVVVGTVVDPNMTDELRVTVVATGLGGAIGGGEQSSLAVRLVENTRPDGSFDYQRLDRPTVMRRQTTGATTASAAIKRPAASIAATATALTGNDANTTGSMDYLDIPAFLRRQAD